MKPIPHLPPTAVIHATAWGKQLVWVPGNGFMSGWCVFSHGGSHTIRANEASEAMSEFARECVDTQAYWATRIGPRSIIVNGEHYSDAGWSNSRNDFRGFGGHVWGIERLADSYRWTTNNLWHQGVVPDELGLADTHRFLREFSADLPRSSPVRGLPQLSVEQQRIVEH